MSDNIKDRLSTIYVIRPRKCTGCRTCELACSMYNGSGTELGRSRISIINVSDSQHIQMNCLQCATPACTAVCSVDALFRNPKTLAIEVDNERCIGCGLCENACPFGHMHFCAEEGVVQKCDLCKGEPTCAKFCPSGALAMQKK